MTRPPLMSDFMLAGATPLSRRSALGAAAVTAGGVAAGVVAASPAGAAKPGYDLMDPETNLKALLKLQADLAEKDVLGGFPGDAWAWVPNKGNTRVFKTYGIGSSRLQFMGDGVWRFFHRELLYYLDPKTGEILETWTNPITNKKVEVLHILNDPVNRIYKLKGGLLDPPFPHYHVGDRVVFQLDVLRSTEKSPMSRADYPMQSQQDLYQSGEMWAVSGSYKELADPKVTSAENHTAWARVGMWLPFMEMADLPGVMIYHSQSFKFKKGKSEIPANILAYTEKNHPEYLEAPKEWRDLKDNENTWSYSKKIIDQKRAAGKARPDGSVFGAG